MAKSKTRRRRSSRRSPRRHSKPHFTAVNAIQALVGLGPVATYAYDNYKGAGGGVNGLTKGILPTLSTAYTGYNPNDKKFRPGDMVIGYVPLVGALFAGKLLNRFKILQKLRI